MCECTFESNQSFRDLFYWKKSFITRKFLLIIKGVILITKYDAVSFASTIQMQAPYNHGSLHSSEFKENFAPHWIFWIAISSIKACLGHLSEIKVRVTTRRAPSMKRQRRLYNTTFYLLSSSRSNIEFFIMSPACTYKSSFLSFFFVVRPVFFAFLYVTR